MTRISRHLLRTSIAIALLISPGSTWASDPLPETTGPDNPAPFLFPEFEPVPPPVPVAQPVYPVLAPVPPPLGPSGTGDRVFLAPFQSYDPALNGEAARLTQMLRVHMHGRYNLITIDQVPPWPDYDALIYLLGCPQGQYSGCALVCGNRVTARWSVGATVTRGMQGGANATLSFIENSSAREVISFGVALSGQNDPDLQRAIDVILTKLIQGAFAQIDLRRTDIDPVERSKLEAARNKLLAESIIELERKEGAVTRQVGQVQGPDKIDKEKLLDDYRDREEVKPWEVARLSEGAFVRYKNSGIPLETWRHLAKGRMGSIILRGAMGGGSGPFGQTFDGRYAIDDNLDRAELEQFQYISSATHVHLDLEVGMGILPFLDVTGHYAYRNSQFIYTINQERVGSPVIVDSPVRNAYATWQAGGRIALVPFPVQPVRPSFHVGVAYWKGSSWDLLLEPIRDLEPMLPMSQILIQVGPGVEITTSERVHIFVRGLLDMTAGGQIQQRLNDGGASLVERADPTTFKKSNAGFSLQAGITLRLRLFGTEKTQAHRPSSRFEDENEL